MKITAVLMRWKKPPPGGHMWRGKYKLYKKVTALDIAMKRAEYDMEEKNMFYLRHPYLTPEQALGYAKFDEPLNLKQDNTNNNKNKKESVWRLDRHLGDRFGFLKITEKWE